MHSCHGSILYDLLLITLRSMFLLYLSVNLVNEFCDITIFLTAEPLQVYCVSNTYVQQPMTTC